MYLMFVKKTVQEGEERFMFNEWEGQATGFIRLEQCAWSLFQCNHIESHLGCFLHHRALMNRVSHRLNIKLRLLPALTFRWKIPYECTVYRRTYRHDHPLKHVSLKIWSLMHLYCLYHLVYKPTCTNTGWWKWIPYPQRRLRILQIYDKDNGLPHSERGSQVSANALK